MSGTLGTRPFSSPAPRKSTPAPPLSSRLHRCVPCSAASALPAADDCVQAVSNVTVTTGASTQGRSVQFAYYGPNKQVRARAPACLTTRLPGLEPRKCPGRVTAAPQLAHPSPSQLLTHSALTRFCARARPPTPPAGLQGDACAVDAHHGQGQQHHLLAVQELQVPGKRVSGGDGGTAPPLLSCWAPSPSRGPG